MSWEQGVVGSNPIAPTLEGIDPQNACPANGGGGPQPAYRRVYCHDDYTRIR